MTPLLRLNPCARRKVMHLETTCFRFPCSGSLPLKTGNRGAEKLPGRVHPTMYDVYLLHRLLEDSSTKSYGEEKTHRNSTNNSIPWSQICQSFIKPFALCFGASHFIQKPFLTA